MLEILFIKLFLYQFNKVLFLSFIVVHNIRGSLSVADPGFGARGWGVNCHI